MPGYYVYTLERQPYYWPQPIICDSDEEAKGRAKQLVDGYPVEL
jgi:hypothetical protein